ncbi:MAG: glycerol-3-phosphate 1-O-acyltransferase [Candidatus Auribacter fodinae]|uniref:Glycerol-3-phosphate acyltransferase n=1 Tax=Candidatus Auribacter fodinae TaxID=2093366 RepID=A0A3A4R2I7_9BACT|nr:MAG: glycerol-3-phosphate 1-O-acyltransferase [Candidatus Auribacter fodinae]
MVHFMLALCYFIGAFPPGYIVAKLWKGIDIREHGSGNIGFTNVLRVLGKKAGIITLICDVGKGVLAVYVATYAASGVESPTIFALYRAIGGALAIIGHNWPVFIGFRGGKGVATSLGVFLGLAPIATLIATGIWIFLLLISNMVSLSSIITAALLPLIIFATHYSIVYIVIGILMAVMIIIRHKSNIARIIRGEENKFFKKAR